MTTVQLNTITRRLEVFSSARDVQARAGIDALEARTMADWTYVPAVTGGATRTQAAWNAERMSFSDFEAGGGVSAWNRALTWLNGANRRTLFLPSGQINLDTTSLDPIIGTHKAIIGQGMGTQLVKPAGSGANNLVFKIGDTTDTSATRIQIANFQIIFIDWATAVGAAFIIDGAMDVLIDILRAQNVTQWLELGPTPDVFAKQIELQLRDGSWRAEADQHFIHHKRANHVDIRKCLCNSGNPGDGYAYYLEAKDHSSDTTGNDGLYVSLFSVFAIGSEYGVVLDSTVGRIANHRWESPQALDHTTESAVLIKADAGSTSNVKHIAFRGCRSTPGAGQALRLENNGNGRFEDISFHGFAAAKDAHVAEIGGSGWYENIVLDMSIVYTGEATPQINDLVRVGASNVKVKIISGPGTGPFPGRTPYDYVAAITADVDNVHLDIQDNGADVGLVEHFAYSSGGNDIIVNGVRYPSEGTFEPTFTFGTPGDLAVTYASRSGKWWKRDGFLHFALRLAFTPTYTTASGTARIGIGDLPDTSKGSSPGSYSLTLGEMGNMVWASTAKQYLGWLGAGTNIILVRRVRDGNSLQSASIIEFPSGTEYTVAISGSYPID